VTAGAPLVRLDTRELALALRSAEQDVLAQEAAVQQLLKGASEKVTNRADKSNADQIAQAQVAVQAKQLQLEKARAEDPSIGVAAAQARVKQLELSIAQTRAQDPAPSVTAAEVAFERAQIALSDTQDEYNKALDRPWEDQDIRDAWAKKLEQAQLDHKAAQAQLDNALNAQQAHTVGLNILAAQVEEAKTQLAQAIVAQEAFSTTLKILETDVEAARLQLRALETWDNPYRDEASAEEVAQARAMLEKTQLAVEQLRVQMEDAELAAPFAGIIVDVQVEIGDQVNPGQVVVILATLDDIEIHTTDLTELDVGNVAVDQPVKITVDALPDREFAGTVDEIALQGQDYRGDVVYEVTVTLDNPEEATVLRWGMTAMVEIVTR
jgi:multidrug efflux pump subunit AcrA (membrane-fusion protein)